MAVIGRGQITVHIAEQGTPGPPGTSSHLHIRYSNNANGNPMLTTPNAYIGIAVTTSATAPTSYASYAWSQLAGRAGSDGVPGTSSYIHIRYSANANGNPMTTIPAKYIGVAVTGSATAPTAYTAYVWAQLTGDKGDKGDKGDPGAAGTAGPGVVYRGTFSSGAIYYNNYQRRDIVKYGTTYYIYKGANAVSGAWSTANWESFGAEFTSVATGLLLAQLAYIENLGVRNLVTAPSGQRIEITAARNSMAFYTAAQTTPVLEIKTTSDGIYMGQGAGFQIKQSGVNISMFKGYLHQGSEGSGISIPVLPIGQPETISQLAILQDYTNSNTTKYKSGIYIDISGTQGTASTSDRMNAIYLQSGGMFIGGEYNDLRSNNVFSGLVAAGTVSATGALQRSWVLSYMGGYLTCSRTSAGRYRITFSKTSYLYSAHDYNVLIMANGPTTGGKTGAYGCTMARTSSYFDVWMADDASANDCGFTFIVFLTGKFWSY